MVDAVDVVGLKKFWRRGTGELRFVVTGESAESVTRPELVEYTRQVESLLAGAGPDHAVVNQWVRTPVGWSGYMRGVDTIDRAAEWVTTFLDVAPGEWVIEAGPKLSEPRFRGAVPVSAMVAYSAPELPAVSFYELPFMSVVSEEIALRVAHAAVPWVSFPEGLQFLSRWEAPIRVLSEGLAETLAEMAFTVGSPGVEVVQPKPYRRRHVVLDHLGLACFQVQEDPTPWRDQVEAARRAMLFAPEDTDLGFLTRVNFPLWVGGSHSTLHLDGSLILAGRPLFTTFVPHAWGLMLLTREHLDRASDLSGWSTTRVAEGRYVLEARDLEPWYAHQDPDPEVQAQAVADFGEMVLTPEAAAANNPWPRGVAYHRAITQMAARST